MQETARPRAESARGRGVLEGAFAVLEALRHHGGEAGVTELALACGVPKATVHRLLEQLIVLDAVERRGQRYRLGARLYRLGQAWQPHPGLREAARLPLHRLRAATGGSVLLAVLREDRALTVRAVPGSVEPLVPVRSGAAFSLDTALGKALRGPRATGALLDREQVLAGVCCAALPVRSPGGAVVGALAAMVPAGQPLATVARAVAETATAVTRGLSRGAGGRPVALPPGLLN
ncbi:IclR family transcriptional regulator [Streptomyces sp. WAC06614]|uniref:IclR family transcriptional regulator n=1 Tax=Streptomyces sp. WAC06614 TaxID=2487416 RepID=UPI000F777959|nr:helix-turn-helix domain-containing protein [Streptomyces sp. WAC06614]RSS76651.1 IclR family transcriptional regulator [Streptomyces sp. WAC06614]